MKLFLDTNVLIDYLAQRDDFYMPVRTLCIASYFGDVELWVSTQSFIDADYILRRYLPAAELSEMMAASLCFFRPCGVQAVNLKPALESTWPDVEDFLIAASAQAVDADYLVTRDQKGFAESKICVLSPQEAVELLKEQGFEYAEMDVS